MTPESRTGDNGTTGESKPAGGRKKPIMIGVLAVVVVTAIIGVVAGKGISSGRSVTDGAEGGGGFCVMINDVIGLYKGNPVTQMGFRVGEVTAIENAGSRVKVTFSLDSGRAYPADVTAVTRSKSLLADRSLELVGNYTGGPTLRKGQCITKSFTPKNINEFAGSASDFLKDLSDNGGLDLQKALDGADTAFAGTGPKAHAMYVNAAKAAQDPDGFTADIGSAIRDMAPLTKDALTNWDTILSITGRAPAVAGLGTELFYHVARFCRGIGWAIALMYDIWQNYGHELKPLLFDIAAPELADVAKNRAPGWAKDLSRLSPAIADALKQQTSTTGGLSIPYSAPAFKLDKRQCAAAGKACDTANGTVDATNLVTLVLQKAGIR